MIAASALAGAAYFVARLSRRSGVESSDLAARMPGDDLIPDTGYIADRAVVIHATPEQIWPWLQQLGKGRGGWYFPSRVEPLLIPDKTRRGSRVILPEFQNLSVGDVVPDWGPGHLEVLQIEPNRLLVYGSVTSGEYLFSWVHRLEPMGNDATRVYTRLRLRRPKNPLINALMPVMGLFDWATMALMYVGLRENVTLSNWPKPPSNVYPG